MSKKKELLFTVTLNDCRVDTFTVGGNGGGGKDTSNTGVRITHLASGAQGRAVDSRSQHKNKVLAFQRMAASPKFRGWHKLHVAQLLGSTRTIEEQVNISMQEANLKIEVVGPNGTWVEERSL